jgi:hypothetical protein
MTQEAFLTIGELAQQVKAPIWKVRRVVDALRRDLPRAGLYRLVPLDMLPQIVERLNEQRTAIKEAAGLVQDLRARGLDINTAAELERGQR